MNKLTIISHVENGSPKRNRKLLADAFKSFEGKDIEVTIQRKRKRRSNNQGAYYFGVVCKLIQMGLKDAHGENYSIEEIHEFLKGKFLYKEITNEDTGEVIKIAKSTTELTTTEMEEYLMECRAFSLEFLGVTIELPNEQLTIG